MQMSSLSSLEGLTDIGLRGRADMRPTLLRVLTDLYVQKPTHTPDEERHYTELALRLLDSVDVTTRSAVAARLANHLSPPSSVIARLASDLPDVAAALRRALPPRSRGATAAAERPHEHSSVQTADETAPDRDGSPAAPREIDASIAGELNELFFAADALERRLILRNLHIVGFAPADRARIACDPIIGRKLEAAALARRHEDFARELARALRISRRQARRIAGDELGEPIVVAAKALSISRDLLYRILLFVNTAVGHSVERVHALASLFDEITMQAAQDLLAVWRAANKDERSAASHRPLVDHHQPTATRSVAVPGHAPGAAHEHLQREAS